MRGPMDTGIHPGKWPGLETACRPMIMKCRKGNRVGEVHRHADTDPGATRFFSTISRHSIARPGCDGRCIVRGSLFVSLRQHHQGRQDE